MLNFDGDGQLMWGDQEIAFDGGSSAGIRGINIYVDPAGRGKCYDGECWSTGQSACWLSCKGHATPQDVVNCLHDALAELRSVDL